ncbi:hypothetical protein MY8738_008835 [Beauveria namnaoensis]
MTRRIVRNLIQLTAAAVFTVLVVLFLDRSYRVLPTSLHNYLPTHHPGHVVTDVTLVTCSTVNPLSKCDLNPNKWHRIDKELFLGQAWMTNAYLFVSRKHEEELTEGDAVVVDLKVGPMKPVDEKPDSHAVWESRPGGIWVKRSSQKVASDSNEAITNVDVLFGDDAVEARDGWAIRGTPLQIDSSGTFHSAHVTVRRGAPIDPKKPKPRIPDSGKFKILQIADLHLSTGVGLCRDVYPELAKGEKCEADPRTLEFVDKMIDEEKPDFVVLSGDQVNGETARDPQSAIFKIALKLKERKLPYAAIFGNHDDAQAMSREAQMAIMESLPYSLATAGPAEIDGVGNYYVEVLGRGGSDHSAITIYFFDTHSYSPNEKKYPGYDWVKPSQIEWFNKTADRLVKPHAEYSHQHMDIAFIHIPITEYSDYNQTWVGSWREGVTAPVFNPGFRDALVDKGILMVSAGHDHVNDYCILSTKGERRDPAMWMCYAGGVGFGGYAGYGGYLRRVRLYEVDVNAARILTWKRVEAGPNVTERIDQQIIVDGGKAYPAPLPPAPPPPAASERPVDVGSS